MDKGKIRKERLASIKNCISFPLTFHITFYVDTKITTHMSSGVSELCQVTDWKGGVGWGGLTDSETQFSLVGTRPAHTLGHKSTRNLD